MRVPNPRILEVIILLSIWLVLISALGIHYLTNENNQCAYPQNPYYNETENNTPFNGELEIDNAIIENNSYNLILAVYFDKNPNFPVDIVFQNQSMVIAEDYFFEGAEEDEIVIYHDYNLNGTYWVVARYSYNGSYIFDKYWLNFTPGISLISHYEEETYYDWENQTEVNPIYVNIKNTGDAPIILENYECIVKYENNGTIADCNNDSILSTVIGKGFTENITLYPYFYLESNQTYTIILKMWGENSDVKFEFDYQIKT